MIDTIKIIIPYKDIVITKPQRFGGDIQIAQLENCFIAGDGKIEYINNPTAEEKKLGYFPRLALAKTAYLSDDSRYNLLIECSLPKILFNNNVDELKTSDLHAVIEALREKMSVMGVEVLYEVIENAYVRRVDYSKNFIIRGDTGVFIRYLDKIGNDPRVGNFYRDYHSGMGIKFSTKQYHVMIYDKIAEICHSLKYSDSRSFTQDNYSQTDVVNRLKSRNVKIIRYEVSLKRKKIKKLGVEECTLRYIFDSSVSRQVLTRYINKIHKGMRSLNTNDMDSMMETVRIKRAFPNATATKVSNLLSLMRTVKENGYSFLRSELGMSASAISRLRNDMRTVNAIEENVAMNEVFADMLTIEASLERFRALRLRPRNQAE